MEYVYHSKLINNGEIFFSKYYIKKNGHYESYSLYTELRMALYKRWL